MKCSRCGDSGFDRNSVLTPETPEGHWHEHTWVCAECDWKISSPQAWERIIWDRVTGVRVTA